MEDSGGGKVISVVSLGMSFLPLSNYVGYEKGNKVDRFDRLPVQVFITNPRRHVK